MKVVFAGKCAYLERFTYIPTGSMTARTFSPSSPQLLPINYSLLTSPNAAFNVNRADELTRHVKNGVATITGTADPQATVTYYPTAATPPLAADQDGTGNWIAPNVPLYPRPDGTNAIQFRIEKDGQPPMFRLSEFAVNKVTTPIGSDGNGSLTNHPCSSVSINGQNIPDHLFYDCEGNLASVSNTISGAVDSYWYDSTGRRIAHSSIANHQSPIADLTLYLWDGMDIIATGHQKSAKPKASPQGDRDFEAARMRGVRNGIPRRNGNCYADGSLREYFTRGPGIAGDVGSLIAETHFTGGTTSTAYLHSNWRGDVVMATDPSGNIIGEYAYTTFGEPLSVTGTYTPRFGFSSKERDASGLVYYGFRYYSPILCRWISEDPIREAGGLNLYQFCGNDSINLIDPYGESGWSVTGPAAVAGTAINFALNIYLVNHGNADAATFKLLGVIPVGIITGKNFERRTPAARSVILEHEASHMYGFDEVGAYQNQLWAINDYLSTGRYGEFLGKGGRDLTCEERQELLNMKSDVEAMLEFFRERSRLPWWKKNPFYMFMD